jgi:exosome complex component MTR3
VHLETALRGVVIGDRWPKSGVEVIVTILEAEEDRWGKDELGITPSNGAAGAGNWGMMSVLSGCISVASAAITDAGIDCVDMVTGGVAALVWMREDEIEREEPVNPSSCTVVLDPTPSEHSRILAACVVGYLPSRDEITDLWLRGSLEKAGERNVSSGDTSYELLIDGAIQAALGAHGVLTAAVREAAGIGVK